MCLESRGFKQTEKETGRIRLELSVPEIDSYMSTVIRLHCFSRWLYMRRIPFIPKLLDKTIRIVFGCELKHTAEIGKNVRFVHNGLGVVIHKHARIGDGTVVYQNVTIGGNGKPKDENGVPAIGRNVFVGAGAVILGPVTIGDNSKIGANAVVLTDVPAGETFVGNPANKAVPRKPTSGEITP